MQGSKHLQVAVSFAVFATLASAASGCGSSASPSSQGDSICASTPTVSKLSQGSNDKIDLLLAIDNSRSMADKQQILSLAVPDLVSRLVNPYCIDANMIGKQPITPTDACPAGSNREFPPILDIHIGVVDSSLGGHGADACPETYEDSSDCGSPTTNSSNDDHGHLVTRKDPCLPGQIPTYQSLGFLAWDPGMNDTPPGESNITTLGKTVADLVIGVGQIGCGFESQEEAWFRFLVDPNPYQSISVQNGQAVKTGRDDALLKERSDFLRPSSLLAIVMLTDENDCSAREGGQYYVLEQLESGGNAYHLPPARAECKTSPNDPCCKSCGQPAGSCPPDPTCNTKLDNLSDATNLRCFDDKRRFGIDFLYPWQRYVNALTQPTINPNNADLSLGGGAGVPNPIFSDLQPNDDDTTVRTSDLVVLTGIVGVPWQDIAKDPTDLTKGFKTANELSMPDANGLTAWDLVVGDPDHQKPPTDPFMIEQIDPRATGAKNPVTGDAIAAPSSPNGTSKINGHEYAIGARDDLQYACIFTLPTPRDCSKGQSSCDCPGVGSDLQNPLCDPNPNDGMKPTLQARGKAYPGVRHLQILKGLGSQGIVASVCPKQLSNPTAADFGYRPALDTLVRRLNPEVDGQCLPLKVTAEPGGHVDCVIVEARHAGGPCVCDPTKARAPVAADHECVVKQEQLDPANAGENWNCFCEIEQTRDADLIACQNDASSAPIVDGHTVNGYCYVDVDAAPPVGNPAIVEGCPSTQKRILRFLGKSAVADGATTLIACGSP